MGGAAYLKNGFLISLCPKYFLISLETRVKNMNFDGKVFQRQCLIWFEVEFGKCWFWKFVFFEIVPQTRATAVYLNEKTVLKVCRGGSRWVDVVRSAAEVSPVLVCKQTVYRVFRSLNLTRPATPEECGGFKGHRLCRRPITG